MGISLKYLTVRHLPYAWSFLGVGALIGKDICRGCVIGIRFLLGAIRNMYFCKPRDCGKPKSNRAIMSRKKAFDLASKG